MSLSPIPPFGVSEFTSWPWSFEQDIENYSALGVEGIEICEFKLDETRAQAQLERVGELGLNISSVQPKLHSLFPDQPRPEPQQPRERMALYRQTIQRFAPVAPGTTLVSISGAAPDGNYRLAYETAVQEYRVLAEFAGEHGLKIALEPLHPILMNIDTFICTLGDALEIVAAVDLPNFGVFVDVWHLWPDPNAERLIRENGDKIFGVHINDWHRPRHFGDRVSLGKGQIDLSRFLRALHASGYSGTYTLELFSSEHLPDSLWKTDLTQLITENKVAFENLWQQALGEICN